MKNEFIHDWAYDVLRCPRTGHNLQVQADRLTTPDGLEAARCIEGVIRFPIVAPDASICFYQNAGGAHFYERAAMPFAMSTLDTPVYHANLDEALPDERDGIIVDVGGGDGRNAIHLLRRGYRRIIVIDVVAEALMRFRGRVSEQNPEWLDRILLIEADARVLPLSSDSVELVIAVETLYYLNEDYEIGLRECLRLLRPSGKIFLSERDYEGALVLSLIYRGIEGMLQLAHKRFVLDGPADALVRTRCFTQAELTNICEANGLQLLRIGGMPLLPLLIGFLNGRNLLDERDPQRLPGVSELLLALTKDGVMRRCNIIIAKRRN